MEDDSKFDPHALAICHQDDFRKRFEDPGSMFGQRGRPEGNNFFRVVESNLASPNKKLSLLNDWKAGKMTQWSQFDTSIINNVDLVGNSVLHLAATLGQVSHTPSIPLHLAWLCSPILLIYSHVNIYMSVLIYVCIYF